MNMTQAFEHLHAQRDDVVDIATHYRRHAGRWAYYEDILDEYGADDTDLFDGHFDPIDQPIGRYLLVQVGGHQKWITTWDSLQDLENYLDTDDADWFWTIERVEDMDNGQHYRIEVAHKAIEIGDDE